MQTVRTFLWSTGVGLFVGLMLIPGPQWIAEVTGLGGLEDLLFLLVLVLTLAVVIGGVMLRLAKVRRPWAVALLASVTFPVLMLTVVQVVRTFGSTQAIVETVLCMVVSYLWATAVMMSDLPRLSRVLAASSVPVSVVMAIAVLSEQ